MSQLDRRQFLAAMSAAIAACDRVVVEVRDDGVFVDASGHPYIPEITPNASFYVYNVFSQPEVDPTSWRLRFHDRGAELGTIDQAFLDTLPARDVELTLQCIGASVVSRRIGNAVWTGLPLAEVLAAAGISGPPAGTVEIVLRGADDYHASVPVEDYEDAPIWLVWGMNGEALSPEHGAPARLMIPGRYGIKNLKWITSIGWVDRVHEGYWDRYGWSHTGEYKVCGFIHVPSWHDEVRSPVTVLGSAFAGRDPIVSVELTDDGGKTWMPCTLDYNPGADRWTLWSFVWRPRQKGDQEIQVRATTAGGQVTVMDPGGSNGLNGYDGGQLLPLVVV